MSEELDQFHEDLQRDIRISRLENRVDFLEGLCTGLLDRVDRLQLHARILHVAELSAEDRENRSQFYTMSDLREKFGCSRATIYLWMDQFLFPRQAGQLGHGNRQVWSKSAVDEWEERYGTTQKRKTLGLVRRINRLRNQQEAV